MRVFVIFLLFSFYLSAQETSHSRKAKKAFIEAKSLVAIKEYSLAYEFLTEALEIDPRFIEALILIADVSVVLGNKTKAIEAYKKSIQISPRFSAPIYFRLAKIEYSIGEYSDALKHINKYLSSKSISDKFRKKAIFIRKSCEFSIHAMKNPVEFNPINLGNKINSNADEYLPALSGDGSTLVFTRSQSNDGYRNEDFYVSYNNNNKWELAENIGPPINTSNNEGAQCITPDGKKIYFTVCSKEDSFGGCDLYESYLYNGNWSSPVNLGPQVNSESWESQPAISSDGRQLYFVSNRTGGQGGKDIWYTYKNINNQWTQAKNLGKEINSSKDDISPFLHFDNQTLYFSSKGYTGMGGFDIFFSRLKSDGNWGAVKNIGFPINSPSDENSLIVAKDGKTAYFASSYFNYDRTDLDLYTFDLPYESRAIEVCYIQGKIKDSKTHQNIQANIELVNLESRKVFNSFQSDESGDYIFCLPKSANFALTVSKEDYLFYSENIYLSDQSGIFVKNFELQPLEIGQQLRLDNIFFEQDSYLLKDKSYSELNKIIFFMELNPFLVIEIGGHTDNVGMEDYNLNLSNQRAQSVKNALLARGLKSDRIRVKGYGFSKPLNKNQSEEEKSENRRTELTIISVK